MRIILDDGLFKASDITQVSTLCVVLANSRHIVFFDNRTAAFSRWSSLLPSFSSLALAYLHASVAKLAFYSSGGSIVVIDGPSDWNAVPPQLSFKDALIFCSTPLKIFVENFESDRAFIKAFMSAGQCLELEGLEKKGWVQFVHGGGIGDLRKQIEHEFQVFAGASLRCFAFFDNDGLKPTSPSRNSKLIEDTCKKYGMKFKQLERRAIENYIHVNALMLRTCKRFTHRTVTSFARLSVPQRDHYNMKDGFRGDRKRNEPKFNCPAELAYAKKFLDEGFGDDIWEAFLEPTFQTTLDGDEKKRVGLELEPVIDTIFRMV